MSTKTTKTITTRPRRRPQQQKRKQTVVKKTTVSRPARRPKKKVRATGKQHRGKNYIVGQNNVLGPVRINEMIEMVPGSIAFDTTTFALNPANPLLFPITAELAKLYDRYEFEDLELSFQPSQSSIGEQGQGGYVDISVTADAIQGAPATQQAAEALPHCPQGPLLTCRPWTLVIPKKFMQMASNQWRFCRPNGAIPGGSDPHEYDAGQLFLWTVGQKVNGTTCGQIKIKGFVKLMNRVLESASEAAPNFTVGQFIQSNPVAMPNNVGTPIPYTDISPSAGFANNIGAINTAGALKLPAGNYLISSNTQIALSGNSTLAEIHLLKNGSTQISQTASWPSGAYPLRSLNLTPTFVTSNGNDSFAISVLAQYTTGAAQVNTSEFTIQVV